jgi:hypothetical protein
MQRWGWGYGGMELLQDALQLSESDASELLSALFREGYVRKCPASRAVPGCEYELTAKGTELALASTARPLPRKTVQGHLHELIERMKRVNSDERFLVGVEEASVFGEYLTNAGRLGNLDVRYTTYRKIAVRREYSWSIEQMACASGIRFSSDVERLLWPEDEVKNYLQDSSSVCRFFTNMERPRDEQTHRVPIFRDRAPVPGWPRL